MAGIASDDHLVSTNDSWLWNAVHDDLFQVPSECKKPRIQKVARTLLKVDESNKGCFDPLVVSFGPCHHDASRLQPMESFKLAAARWFVLKAVNTRGSTPITQEAVENVYYNFVRKAPSFSYLRGCYDDDIVKEYDETNFMRMMFLDGCLILLFIHPDRSNPLKISRLDISLIPRDMFLLENQIPYEILETLMSLMPEMNEPNGSIKIKRFIERVLKGKPSSSSGRFTYITNLLNKFPNIFTNMNMYSRHNNQPDFTGGGSNSPREKEGEYKPIHLLDFLRFILAGKDESGGISYSGFHCRSIKELKAEGIELSRSDHMRSREIEFNQGFIYGHLKLPRIVVDDNTKTLLLNLIAYEMCPDCSLDHTVISYICLLDSLIYSADDVKELRSKKMLCNRLGSDKAVANLFKYLGRNLTPNSNGYYHVMDGIEKHNERHLNHIRLWIGQLIHTHFTTPWTIISLFAAVFVIFLSLVQTTYTVLSYLKS